MQDNRLHHTTNAWQAYCEHNELTSEFHRIPHHTRYWIPAALLKGHFREYCWEFDRSFHRNTFIALLKSLYLPVRRSWNHRSGIYGFAGIKQPGLTITSYGKAAAKPWPPSEDFLIDA